jgi:hypothetical protein
MIYLNQCVSIGSGILIIVIVVLVVVVLVLVLERLDHGNKASSSGIIKCKKYPKYVSANCKHTFGTCLGDFWDTCGCVGHFLTLVGYLLDTFWILVGHF